ncbi:hypothetical protein, partial [Burkholderia sp. Ax-1735]
MRRWGACSPTSRCCAGMRCRPRSRWPRSARSGP